MSGNKKRLKATDKQNCGIDSLSEFRGCKKVNLNPTNKIEGLKTLLSVLSDDEDDLFCGEFDNYTDEISSPLKDKPVNTNRQEKIKSLLSFLEPVKKGQNEQRLGVLNFQNEKNFNEVGLQLGDKNDFSNHIDLNNLNCTNSEKNASKSRSLAKLPESKLLKLLYKTMKLQHTGHYSDSSDSEGVAEASCKKELNIERYKNKTKLPRKRHRRANNSRIGSGFDFMWGKKKRHNTLLDYHGFTVDSFNYGYGAGTSHNVEIIDLANDFSPAHPAPVLNPPRAKPTSTITLASSPDSTQDDRQTSKEIPVTNNVIGSNEIIIESELVTEDKQNVANDSDIIILENENGPDNKMDYDSDDTIIMDQIVDEIKLPEVLNNPSIKHNLNSGTDVENKWECPICLDGSNGQEICTTICGHIFCKLCIQAHLSSNNKCPSCRQDIKNQPLITLYNFGST